MTKSNNIIKIAILLTCFNRKDLTLSCLESVKKARDKYNALSSETIVLHTFITDDNCTDGTSDAVKKSMIGEDLHIIKSDGNSFWAGGMRISWKAAMANDKYDFFLLLNDDTEVWENVFNELLNAHSYSLTNFGKGGIYSGNTTWKSDRTKISFGGKKSHGIIKRFYRLIPNGIPQRCDIVNANILMISYNVVDHIGIFPDCYIHGAADNDYGMRANQAGYPVLITANFCGSCDADNYDIAQEYKKLKKMTLRQRINYFKFPTRSIHDTIQYSIRWRKLYVPIIYLVHLIHVCTPSIYMRIINLLNR